MYDDGEDEDTTQEPSESDSESDNDRDTEEADDTESENTPVADVEEHREAIGDALGEAANRQGVTLADLAAQIGLSSEDVNELTHDDLLTAAKHLAQEHPDLVDSFVGRLPLGNVLGGFVKNFLAR